MPFVATVLTSLCSAGCLVGALLVGNYVLIPLGQGIYIKLKRWVFNRWYLVHSFNFLQNAVGTAALLKYVSKHCHGQTTSCLADPTGAQLNVGVDQWFKVKIEGVTLHLRVNTTNTERDPNRNGQVSGVTVLCSKWSHSVQDFESAMNVLIKSGKL